MKTQTKKTTQKSCKAILSFVILFLVSILVNPLLAQTENNGERIVSGKIITDDGEPLLGAAIVLKGTTVSTVSNVDGEFTFPKPLSENDVLQISYLGLNDQEIIINKNTQFIKSTMVGDPVIIIGALRMSDETVSSSQQ